MQQSLSNIILLVICCIAGFYLLQNHWQDQQQIAPDSEAPVLSAEKVKTTNFDENGTRNYTLESAFIEYFKQLDETHFEQPILQTYQFGTNKEWQVKARFAVLEGKKMLVMTGNVEIINLLPDAPIKYINTEKVTLNLTSQDFWSEREATLSGVSFDSRGGWVKGNFGSHQIELIDHVKSKYEPQTK